MTAGWKDFKGEGRVAAKDELRTLGLLIVDDEKEIVTSLKEMFRSAFDIYPAHSAAEALELFKHHGPKLVLTDQRMPTTDGLDLLRQLKEIDPTIICLLVTGYSDISVVIDALNEGLVWKYISKPWDHDELRDLVVSAGRQYLRDQGLDLGAYRLSAIMGC
jgi:serine/threonine-protein kinase